MEFHPAYVAIGIAISFGMLPFIGMFVSQYMNKSAKEMKQHN